MTASTTIATCACYECIHHRTLPTGQTSCHHPLTEAAHRLPVAGTIEELGHALPMPVPGMRVVGNARAIAHGYWSWPFSFDPTWLVDCDKFEAIPERRQPGRPPINWTPDMLQRLRELRARGVPLQACADELGVDYGTARRRARVEGLNDRLNRGQSGGEKLWTHRRA